MVYTIDKDFEKTIPDQEGFDIMPMDDMGFEDEVDAALAPDKRVVEMEENLEDVEIDEPEDNFDDTVVDSDMIEDPSEEDYDAEEYAKAEKELISNPFEDDEVIDAAIGNDDDIEDLDLEEEF